MQGLGGGGLLKWEVLVLHPWGEWHGASREGSTFAPGPFVEEKEPAFAWGLRGRTRPGDDTGR